MRPITLIVLVAGIWGTRRLLAYADERRAQRERSHAVTTWEGEGGAVPITANRTAAQVEPDAAARAAATRADVTVH